MPSGNGNKSRLADSFHRSQSQGPLAGADMTDRERMLTNSLIQLSAIATRQDIAARLGKSYSDNRKLYTALGYKLTPTYEDFAAKYQRMDIARTIIDLPVRECWRNVPMLTESQDKETAFEKAWIELCKKHRIFHYLSRADRLGSLGTYSVLFLGFNDSADTKQEATTARDLLYLMPYSMVNATISQYDIEPKSERYGKPLIYKISPKSISSMSFGKAATNIEVHHSRIIHVAEDCLEDDVEGIPRLRSVLNRLEDIEKLAGGSAEMFWRGAYPGLAFITKEGRTIGSQTLDMIEKEMAKYEHDLQRHLRLDGMDIQNLAPQVADPRGHMDVQFDLLSAATRIPKRILLGSERGELASSQDERNWAKVIQARQREHCEAVLLRPLIDRLIAVKVLPEPSEDYTIEWPDLLAPGDKDKAEIGLIRAKALGVYSNATGAEDILPMYFFMDKGLGMTDEEIQEVRDIHEAMLEYEAADEESEDDIEDDEDDD
jgi:hypothetical protein